MSQKKKNQEQGYTGGDKFFGQLVNEGIGDDSFIHEIVTIFLDESNHCLKHLKQASKEQNLENVQLYSHKLKSSFLMFDMIEAHELVAKMENIEASKLSTVGQKIKRLDEICEKSFTLLKDKYMTN
ncbi:Hpt domain-containing protein [Crocinitomix algicola]|uniref:Hpt domain-containing protein n=1 Tax=Crocinitomix algicola TaxID=1740263 RepID=UPI00082A5A2F|nr:Hpt domain-containing protein [Crocinitomix algicola]